MSFIRETFKPSLIFLRGRGLTNLRQLAICVLVLRWSKADQQSTFELPPYRYIMCMLEPVILLDHVSLEVYDGDVDHRCFRSFVDVKVPREINPVGSPSSHMGKFTLMRGYADSWP
ncbi:hypothetical protein B296_00027616 [Ensete ventricosum]|uniref:Uncharacterized protein n=1 Tax=Ensete ventricosum TaxID=4639 RepID=A0A427A3Y9_ENSVE|nr:hypothetical protein B296_00027616 [Ensete ventricosum]